MLRQPVLRKRRRSETSSHLAGAVPEMAGGGAGFSPRVHPRPSYPAAATVAWKAVVQTTLGPFYAALAIIVAEPSYRWSVARYRSSGWGGAGDRVLFVISFVAVKAAVAVLAHGFFFVIELNRWFDRYKIDRRPSTLPGWALISNNIRDVSVGTFITGPVLLYYVLYPLCVAAGSPSFDAALGDGGTLPEVLPKLWWAFFWCYLLNDWGFYLTYV